MGIFRENLECFLGGSYVLLFQTSALFWFLGPGPFGLVALLCLPGSLAGPWAPGGRSRLLIHPYIPGAPVLGGRLSSGHPGQVCGQVCRSDSTCS